MKKLPYILFLFVFLFAAHTASANSISSNVSSISSYDDSVVLSGFPSFGSSAYVVIYQDDPSIGDPSQYATAIDLMAATVHAGVVEIGDYTETMQWYSETYPTFSAYVNCPEAPYNTESACSAATGIADFHGDYKYAVYEDPNWGALMDSGYLFTY